MTDDPRPEPADQPVSSGQIPHHPVLATIADPRFAAIVPRLHHRIPLKRGVQRPKRTADFALLCPTCHGVVHSRREDPLGVEELRARLQG